MPSGSTTMALVGLFAWCNGLRRKGRCEQQCSDYWRHHPVVESSTARRTVVIPARQVSSWTISEIFIHNAALMLRAKHPQTKNLEVGAGQISSGARSAA